MSSQDFLSGMRSFRRGEPLDKDAPYEFRKGWRHAQFNARPPTSPPTPGGRSMEAVNTGAR